MNSQMFTVTSFNKNGDRLEHAGQIPAFYALNCYNNPIAYFNSIEAVWNYLELYGYIKPEAK